MIGDGDTLSGAAIKPKANEVRVKPLLSGLVALFLLTAVYTEAAS